MERGGAVDDRTNTFGLDNGPDKERDTCDRYDDGFGGEEVAAVK
jgi:hypothetical protein